MFPLGLFLAPRPLLKAGYKYWSPPCSLAACGHVSVRWGRQAPTSWQLQPRAGVWARFPTQKKVRVHLCNKYSQAHFCVLGPMQARVDFSAGITRAWRAVTVPHPRRGIGHLGMMLVALTFLIWKMEILAPSCKGFLRWEEEGANVGVQSSSGEEVGRRGVLCGPDRRS